MILPRFFEVVPFGDDDSDSGVVYLTELSHYLRVRCYVQDGVVSDVTLHCDWFDHCYFLEQYESNEL